MNGCTIYHSPFHHYFILYNHNHNHIRPRKRLLDFENRYTFAIEGWLASSNSSNSKFPFAPHIYSPMFILKGEVTIPVEELIFALPTKLIRQKIVFNLKILPRQSSLDLEIVFLSSHNFLREYPEVCSQ